MSRTSCRRDRRVAHDLAEHLERGLATREVAPLVRGNLVARAKDAHVREGARVLVQARSLAVHGPVRKFELVELGAEVRLQVRHHPLDAVEVQDVVLRERA